MLFQPSLMFAGKAGAYPSEAPGNLSYYNQLCFTNRILNYYSKKQVKEAYIGLACEILS